MGLSEKQSKQRQAILDVLRAAGAPLTSRQIAAELASQGTDLSERSVRLYLRRTDEDGLTEAVGRSGRVLTDAGAEELNAARLLERVGLLSAKIDQMTYAMTFDLETRSGTVVVNTTFIPPQVMRDCVDDVCRVFEKGYAMGQLAALLGPGERVGNAVVPEGMVGLITVCSITLNGVLLKHGVPTRSRFGGLLELNDRAPVRFIEMINYDGSSIDPLEVFIRSGMTDYLGAVAKGSGKIGASFREVPADSRALVVSLAAKVDLIGLGAFLRIGHEGQSLLGIPVGEGRSGAIVIGGLNPTSVFEEYGHRVQCRALSGLMEFNRLQPFEGLKSRIREYL